MDANRAPSQRQIKVATLLKEIAQDFFQRESSGLSLITVTRAEVSPDLRNATFLITVFPENKEDAALDFARRQRSDLRRKIMKTMQTKVIPHVEIDIDYGEKNRQHIDEILRNEKVGGVVTTTDEE